MIALPSWSAISALLDRLSRVSVSLLMRGGLGRGGAEGVDGGGHGRGDCRADGGRHVDLRAQRLDGGAEVAGGGEEGLDIVGAVRQLRGYAVDPVRGLRPRLQRQVEPLS